MLRIDIFVYICQTNEQTNNTDMTKSINTRQYQFAHGKMPKGTGFWFFEDNNGEIFTVRDSYSSAVAAAKKALSGQVITVCS